MSAAPLLRPEPEFRLSYAPEVPCTVMVWRGYHTSASFRDNNEQVLAFLVAHATAKLLCDIRDFLLIDSADQNWLNDYWLPRALAAGLQQCAIVTPLYYFNRVAVQSVVGRIDSGVLQVEYFESALEARRWLASTDVGGRPTRRRPTSKMRGTST